MTDQDYKYARLLARIFRNDSPEHTDEPTFTDEEIAKLDGLVVQIKPTYEDN